MLQIPSLFSTLQVSKYDWLYEAIAKNACLATNGTCVWTRGKMLGGSSSHNQMIFVRGNKHNFDYWTSLGNKGWDYESLLKYYKRWEGNRNSHISNCAEGYYHNQAGPLTVSLFDKDPKLRIFLNAAKECGNEHILDINADKTLGYVYHEGFFYEGLRQSTAKAYLIPAKDRPNLCIVKNATVYKILFDENKRAIGVEYEYKGMKNLTAYAHREITLSAGVVESAKLLLLSGIGSKTQLDQFDIPTICDLPVGENLIDHVGLNLYCQFEGKCPSPFQTLDDIYDYFIHRNGPLASNLGELGGFENSKSTIQYENSNLQVAYAYFPRNSSFFSGATESALDAKLFQINQQFDGGFVRLKINQPKSVGYIRLKTTSYKDPPLINANYFDHPEDVETMLRFIKRQLRFEETKSFRKHNGKFVRLPLPECDKLTYKSDDYWRCYMRYLCDSPSHAVGKQIIVHYPLINIFQQNSECQFVGTCKMAPRSKSGVVDRKLRVYGVTNLRIADASIMPYIVSANTAATTCMIGEKAADLIKKANS